MATKKKYNKQFFVIAEEHGKFKPYDIFPYLTCTYKAEKKDKRPVTFDEFKQFIINEGRYMWWSKCEYEIIISDWPPSGKEEKWDVFQQVMMNIDVITNLFMEHCGVK